MNQEVIETHAFSVSCWLVLLVGFLLPCAAVAEENKLIEVIGEYQYTYGDRESLLEAKHIAYTMAIRRAVESYQIFVEATSKVKDHRVLNDLVQTLSSGYLKDIKVIKEFERGRTVYCKVQAYVAPSVIKTVIEREMSRAQSKEAPGMLENEQLKILSVKEERDQFCYGKEGRWVRILFKAKRNYTPTKIIADLFNAEGEQLPGTRALTDKSDLSEGEISYAVFCAPPDVASYKLRLPEK